MASPPALNNSTTDTPYARSLGRPVSELLNPSEHNHVPLIKLASNENPLGPSPRVFDVIDENRTHAARYPDPSGHELRLALASLYRVTPEQVVLGNGSSEILDLVARTFLSPATSAVYSQYAFVVYPIAIKAAGAHGIEVSARRFGNDPRALLEAIEENTRILFIANPNNPTGTLLEPDELLDLIKHVPENVLIVLDEAYYEYLPDTMAPSSVEWLDKFPNLLIARTFSKAYGLAGMRIGYALAHPSVANLLNRIRQPFNVNALAQLAAMAALGDIEHLAHSVAVNRVGIKQITQGLAQYDVDFITSHGNFITFRVGNGKWLHQGLLDQGVLVRELDNYGMSEYLRVSIGIADENRRFLLALKALLGIVE